MELKALLYKEVAYYKKNLKTLIYNCTTTVIFSAVLMLVCRYLKDNKITSFVNLYAIYFIPVSVIMGNISNSIMFESFDNMTDFLFSQNMKKSSWMFVKIFVAVIYGMCILLLPFFESLLLIGSESGNLLLLECNLVILGTAVSLLAIFIRIQPFTCLSLIFQLLNWLIIAILLLAFKYYSGISPLISFIVIIVMWFINITILRRKETLITIENE